MKKSDNQFLMSKLPCTGWLSHIIASLSQSNATLNLGGGIARNQFFAQSGNGRGRFKQNQRKERAHSRRMKTKLSARN